MELKDYNITYNQRKIQIIKIFFFKRSLWKYY